MRCARVNASPVQPKGHDPTGSRDAAPIPSVWVVGVDDGGGRGRKARHHLTLTLRHAVQVTGARDIPLAPPIPILLLALACIALAWWRESGARS